LASPQAASVHSETRGFENARLSSRLFALDAVLGLDVVGCTSHKEEHQNCKHQPTNNNITVALLTLSLPRYLHSNFQIAFNVVKGKQQDMESTAFKTASILEVYTMQVLL